MMSKSFLLLLFALTMGTPLAFGQKAEPILRAPDNWNSETIAFPLGFAPEIDFVGFEEIRFAPGWSDSNSEEFWTYHFSWFIEKKEPLTEEFLAETFTIYYDGLTRAVLKEQSDSIKINELDQTLCLFIKTSEGFRGKMRVFDSFFTKDYIILRVEVREKICEKSNKQIISFDISPKRFDDEVWEIFQQVEIIENCN